MMKKIMAIGVFFFMTISALSFGELKPGTWKGLLDQGDYHFCKMVWHVDKNGNFRGTVSDELFANGLASGNIRNNSGVLKWLYDDQGKVIPVYLTISFSQPYIMHVKAQKNHSDYKLEGDMVYYGS